VPPDEPKYFKKKSNFRKMCSEFRKKTISKIQVMVNMFYAIND
jgi:hypothetical protein